MKRAVPLVDAGNRVEGVADERGDLDGAVWEQGRVDELGEVGRAGALGEVIDGRQAMRLPAAERWSSVAGRRSPLRRRSRR